MDPKLYNRYRNDHEYTFLEFMQRQAVDIEISHYTDPSNFYIRPCIFNKYIRVIENMPPTEIFKPKLFDLVLVKADDVIKRGQVIHITEDTQYCDVFTFDYGEILSRVVPTNIMVTPEMLSKMSTMSIHSSTYLIVPREGDEWSEQAITAMYEIVARKKLQIIMEIWRGNLAEVRFLAPNDVKTALLLKQCAALDVSEDPDITPYHSNYPKAAKRYYTHHTFQVGEKIKVKFLGRDPKLGFYVTLADAPPFTDEYDATKYKLITWTVFLEYCLVYKTKGNKIFRAIINDFKPNNKFELKLVDSGKMFTTDEYSLYEGPNYVFEQNAMAIYCVTLDELSGKEFAESSTYFMKDFEFDITVKKLGEKFKTPHEVVLSPHRDGTYL